MVFATVQANISNEKTLVRIENLLAQSGVKVVALKGVAMMTGYYSDPFLRPIGDIDLWVAKEEVYKAREILMADGAVNTDEDQPEVIDSQHAHLAALAYRGQTVELHHRLYPTSLNREPSKSIGEMAISRGGHLMLPPAPMLYHLATHAFFSHIEKGARIGWIIDIVMLLDKAEDVASLVREAMALNHEAEDDFRWAMGLAMPLLPQDEEQALASIGFEPLNISPETMEAHHNFVAYKTKLFASKLSTFRTRLNAQKGLKAKLKELRNIWNSEIRHTRENYHGVPLPIALLRRLFGQGIVWNNIKDNKL